VVICFSFECRSVAWLQKIWCSILAWVIALLRYKRQYSNIFIIKYIIKQV